MNNEDKTKKELISELQELQQENNSLKTLYKDISGFKKPESAELLELFFRQGMDGFFFMMLDEPVKWDDTIDKEKTLDYVFSHQRVTKTNDAMLLQYKAKREEFLSLTPNDFFAHDIAHGRAVWKDFFDKGHLHIDTNEQKFDGTPMTILGDYICLYDDKGRITGHFGIQRDVTREREAVNVLSQTHQNYETFFNTINDFLFVLDEQANIIHTNSTVINQLGYTREELAGNSVLMVHPADRREEAGRIVGEMLMGTAEFCPVPLITKSGKQIPVETRVRKGIWNGKPVIFGVTKDVSQIKLSEEKFSKVFYLNPLACGLSDVETGKYVEVNEVFNTLLGFNKNEVIGKTAIDLGILSAESVRKIILKHDKNGNVTNVEAYLNAKNGDIKHVLLSSENIFIQDKKYRYTVALDITERKQAEAELLNADEKCRIITQASLDIIFILDKTGKIIFSNESMSHVLGYQPNEFVGKSFTHFVPKKEIPKYLKILAGVFKHKDIRNFETQIYHKDKHLLDIEINGKLIRHEGKLVAQGTIRDISQRKRSEEKLIESESSLRQAQEIANMGNWEMDFITQEVKWSENYFVINGLKPFEIQPSFEYLKSHVHPDDLHLIDDVMKKINISKSAEIIEFRIILPDKTIKWVLDKMVPYFQDERLVTLKGITIDINDRKQAEEKLTSSERRLSALSEVTVKAVFFSDKGICIETNDSAIKMFGYSYDEIIGKFGTDFIAPESKELVKNNMLSGYAKPYDALAIKKDGSTFWCELSGSNFNYQEKDIRVTSLIDITERKHISEFENILLQLSLLINKTKNEDINSTINYALAEIGSFLFADRAYVFKSSELSNTMSNTYEWCYEGISPEIENLQELPLTIFPMWMKSLRSKENIQIDSVKDLPESWSAEREILEPQGVQSLLVIPILNNNDLMGFLGLDFVRSTKECSQSETNSLRVWANMLAGLLNKQKAEQILNQTRLNYETFFNTIDDFLFVLNKQGNIIHTNNRVINGLEYSIEELLDQSVLMVHPPERREEAGRIVGEMLAGTADFCPVPLISKTGHYIPVETRVNPGFWNGKPVIFGVSKDVTKIELSEQKFSSAFQSNSAMMSISSFEEGKYIDVNKAFSEIMGYSRDEIIGSTNELLGIYIDPEIRQNIISRIKQDIQVHDEEVLMQTKSGEIKTGLVSTDTIYIGNERCTLSVAVDITARKIAEEELKKARLEAEKANLSKSEFLSRMSHELRTPMNSILGFAQLMEMSLVNPAQKERLNHILNSGNHLLKLINEVLDISGIEAGKLTLISEPGQLIEIINEVIDAIQVIANRKNITLELIDSPSNNLFIQADLLRVKQVLLNLIANAINYNKEAGFVKISTELISTEIPGSSKLRISIHDSGIGIKAENISKLFQPFERIGADESETEGTGLGLAIVMKLTKAMGGTVGVESELGVGSTFWIELPQNTNQPSVIRNKEVADKQNALPEDTVFSTVLYIEDNTSNIALVKEILDEYKSSVQLETSMYGKQALSLAKRHKPDLILLDLDLPDIKGSEVLEKLLADPQTKSIPVVIVSADAMSYQIEKLKKAGATDYLTKPIDVIQFLKIINQYCKI